MPTKLYILNNSENKRKVSSIVKRHKKSLFLPKGFHILDYFIFLSLFHEFIKFLNYPKNIFLGIDKRLDFLKSLVDFPDNLYIIPDNSKVINRRFPCVFSMVDFNNFYMKDFNIFEELSKCFFSNEIKINNFYNLSYTNESEIIYSDVIGVLSRNKCVLERVIEETRDIGLDVYNLDYSEFSNCIDSYYKYENKIKDEVSRNSSVLVLKKRGGLEDLIQYLRSISKCRYFICEDSPLCIFPSMILGSDKCLIFSHDMLFKRQFPFSNTLDFGDLLKDGIISEFLNNKYQEEIDNFIESDMIRIN